VKFSWFFCQHKLFGFVDQCVFFQNFMLFSFTNFKGSVKFWNHFRFNLCMAMELCTWPCLCPLSFIWEPSLTTSNGYPNLGQLKTGTCVIANLTFSKTRLQSSIQVNFVLLRVKDVKGATTSTLIDYLSFGQGYMSFSLSPTPFPSLRDISLLQWNDLTTGFVSKHLPLGSILL